MYPLQNQKSQNDLKTFYNFFRFFDHTAIVACDIRFAFSTVYKNIFNLGRILWRKFYMGWKSCSTHTYYPALFDTVQDFFFCKVFQAGFLKFGFLVLLVIFDNNTVNHRTGSVQPFSIPLTVPETDA